jgi:lysozyme
MAKSRYLAGGAAGAALLAAATAYTSHWEGRRYVAYRDVGGVLTVCDGHTGSDIVAGKRYTTAECDAMLQKDLIAHEGRMLTCAPQLGDPFTVPDDTYVAINDWAFNVGTGAACKSTLIRKVKAGDLRGACMELSKWVYVNSRVIGGLAVRRIKGDAVNLSERALCLRGLA